MSINSKSAEEIIRELSQEETVQSTKLSIGTGVIITALINQEVRNKINLMGGRIFLQDIANGSMAAPTVTNQLVVQNVPTLNTLTKTVQLSPAMQSALGNAGSTALAPVTSSEVVTVGGQNALQVTTHGILTKVPWNAVMGAVAVAQGVKLGVDFVEENPELATKISNRVFGTNIDPSEIANIVDNTTVWANIRDGAVFITQDIIEGIRETFMNEGVYSQTGPNNEMVKNVKSGISRTVGINNYKNGAINAAYHYNQLNCWNLEYETGVEVIWVRSLYSYGGQSYYRYWLYGNGNFKADQTYTVAEGRGFSDELPSIEPAPGSLVTYRSCLVNSTNVTKGSWNNSRGSENAPVGNRLYQLPYDLTVIENDTSIGELETARKYFRTGEGTKVVLPKGTVAGTELIPGANYPTVGGSTAVDYPDWWNNRTESYKQYDEDNDEDLHTTWMPVSIFDPATQDDAQQGTFSEENVEDIVTGIDETIEDNPDNNPQTDPQEQEYPNPNPEPSPTLEPITPSPPTVDVSDGESPDPTTPILTTAITSGLSYIYNPTLSETRALGRKLWTLDFIENLKKIFVDPMQAIIGFHILYATPKTGERKNIVLGFYDTEIQSKIVTNQYTTIDCGTIRIGEYFNDARDYETFTSCSIYLPFIGVVDVKADDIINSYTNITYHVDVLTGTCLATVQVTKQNAKAVIYQFVGNCAVTIPLTSGNYTAVVSTLLAVASSAVGGGMAFGAAGAIFGAARSAAVNAHRAKFNVVQSGNLGSNAGAMGIRKPYIIIRRPVTTDAYAYNMQYGYPANKWVLLSNVKDFTRVRSIHLENVPCTDEEKDMIDAALKEGAVF